MEKIGNLQESIRMKIENPFWNDTFSENLPKWIHIWIVSFSFISSILFSIIYLTNYINKDLFLVKLFAFIAIISTILLMFNRDTFLPFLGDNFVPQVFLNLTPRKPKHIEKYISIKTSANTKVIYWAADPGKEIKKTWQKGYNKFENSGVVLSDNYGVAKIPLQCPTRYIVHGYKILPKHLHYRVYNPNTQMLSRIHTIVLINQCKETM